MSPITIGISIMVTLSIAISAALTAKQNLNATKGSVAASQLQVVSAALHNYVLNNTAALINSTAIPAGASNVANILSPTTDELKAMSLLDSNFSSTPNFGGAYLTAISFPSRCTVLTNACPFSELVYYKTPFLSETNTKALDIHVLGNAVTSSSDKNIGFSSTNNPAFITGPGWQVSNPITSPSPGAIGVLGAYKYYSYNASLSNSYNWKPPIDTVANLPSSNNTAGDVRYVINLNTPYFWSGSSWQSFNSTSANTVNLGANASNTGSSNTHLGVNAGLSSSTNSQFNTAVGFSSGMNANGVGNTIIGASSGSSLSSATNSNNTVVGYSSANSLNASNLTILGANVSVSSGVSNSIAIGNGINLTTSNTAVIGPSSITSLVTSAAYATSSDKRLKSDIHRSKYGLSFIEGLKPVDYTLLSNHSRQTGFIAQEVESIAPDFPGLIKPTKDHPYYSLMYTSFVPSLVQAVQELDHKVEASQHVDSRGIKTLQHILLACMGMLLAMVALTCWTHLRFKRMTVKGT